MKKTITSLFVLALSLCIAHGEEVTTFFSGNITGIKSIKSFTSDNTEKTVIHIRQIHPDPSKQMTEPQNEQVRKCQRNIISALVEITKKFPKAKIYVEGVGEENEKRINEEIAEYKEIKDDLTLKLINSANTLVEQYKSYRENESVNSSLKMISEIEVQIKNLNSYNAALTSLMELYRNRLEMSGVHRFATEAGIKLHSIEDSKLHMQGRIEIHKSNSELSLINKSEDKLEYIEKLIGHRRKMEIINQLREDIAIKIAEESDANVIVIIFGSDHTFSEEIRNTKLALYELTPENL